MIDMFQNHAAGLESPASHLHSVVPNNGQDLPFVARASCAGGEGDYNDITLSDSWQVLPEDGADTIIYCDMGCVRFTTHSSPQGLTAGVPLRRGELHLVKAGTILSVRSDTSSKTVLVRSVA